MVAILLIIAAWFSVSKQKALINRNSQALKDTLIEASAVRDDLAELLESSVEISQLIVDNLDERIEVINNLDNCIRAADEKQQKLEQAINNLDGFIPVDQAVKIEDDKSSRKDNLVYMEPTKSSELLPDPEPEEIESMQIQPLSRRLKVYELARELDMSSKKLLTVLNDLGYKVSHHMKTLDENIVQRVKKILLDRPGSGSELANNDSGVQHLSLVGQAGINNEHGTAHKKTASEITAEFSIDDLKNAHPYLAVHTLYEKGLSIRDIAKVLDRGQGEVNLILNLTRKKQACN